MQELFLEIERLVKKSQKILCISHKRPDGDTLGATVALSVGLKLMGKDVDMACVDKIPEKYDFLEGVKQFRQDFNYQDYDLVFVSDAGDSKMTRYDQMYPEMFQGAIPMINLDHHSSNDNFGTLNLVDIQSASTTILIYKIWRFLGWSISPAMATALVTGIYNDTGSLVHQNTTLEVFEITGKLVEMGAKVNVVAKNLFRTTPVRTMKLWGKVLERAQTNAEGVTVSAVTMEDLAACSANTDDLAGVVDFMNSVPNSKFTVLLNEDNRGNVKASFRTRRDDVDLAQLAETFGGGGHKKAAGFTIPGRLARETRWRVLPTENAQLTDQNSENEVKSPLALLGDILEMPVKQQLS